MARTTPRTQQILGMLLECARIDIENLPDMHPYMVGDQDFHDLLTDSDYQKAQDLFFNMMNREIRKNQDRINGANAHSLTEINDLEA
tara:strand:- start:604 stop:864 length:261 start_codon:yes stop_codon:yes gene_type:complete